MEIKQKRGRKPKEEPYFGEHEEKAVVEYLNSTDDRDRNQIYNESLREPLNKMVESIIKKYKLFRKGESFEDLHTDALSFLITKTAKFTPGMFSKKTGLPVKAYSYYGTICKHYLLGVLIKDEKYIKQISSYEDISSDLEGREDLSYVIDDEPYDITPFIKSLIKSIKKEMVLLPNESISIEIKQITDGEIKIGQALIEILTNWEKLFSVSEGTIMDGGVKYNKNIILETIRNYTGLSTKDIRFGMKRYKVLYSFLKNSDI